MLLNASGAVIEHRARHAHSSDHPFERCVVRVYLPASGPACASFSCAHFPAQISVEPSVAGRCRPVCLCSAFGQALFTWEFSRTAESRLIPWNSFAVVRDGKHEMHIPAQKMRKDGSAARSPARLQDPSAALGMHLIAWPEASASNADRQLRRQGWPLARPLFADPFDRRSSRSVREEREEPGPIALV